LAQKQFYLLHEFEQAISSVLKAFDLLPDDAQYAKSFALYWYAFSLHMLGRIPESKKLVTDALNDSSRFNNSTHARIYIISCVLNFLSGDLSESKDAADKCLLLGKEHKLHEAINLAYYFLGSIHFFRNELTETTKYFELLFNNRYTCRSTYAVIGSILLVLIHDARGRDKDARNMMDALHKFILDTDSLKQSEYFRALRTELALMQQDYELAVQIDDGKEYEVYKPMWFTFNPQLSSIKVNMYSQTSASASLAEDRLRKLVEFGRSTYNTYFQIQAMALLALHLWRQGDEKNALGILNESLALASYGRFIRTYVLLGHEMRMILSKLSDNKEHRDFIHQILIAFEKEAQYAKKSSAKSPYKSLSATIEHADIEPLSVREMDVLKLLAQGLRNKEIASGLHIATETVKVHLSKIFKKLRASSRIEVVNVARANGLVEGIE
jgi:ATP/maltotriose-dependent transcriptional regulator MalT